jgi:hypothetical protein
MSSDGTVVGDFIEATPVYENNEGCTANPVS